MEVPGGHKNKGIVCIYEFVGTALLLIAVNWGSNSKTHTLQPIAIGLTLFANICFLGPVSGGHFNPAVTLGVFFKEGRSKFSQNWIFMVVIWFS